MMIQRHNHIIDASGKTVGRLATEIARLLQGKHKASYVSHQDQGDLVTITHVTSLRFSGKKLTDRVFYRHSGHLGGLKVIPMKRVWEATPDKVLRKAVQQMLPKNRLLSGRMKRLMVT